MEKKLSKEHLSKIADLQFPNIAMYNIQAHPNGIAFKHFGEEAEGELQTNFIRYEALSQATKDYITSL